MIYLVLVILAGGVLLAWALDRELRRNRRGTVTVRIVADLTRFTAAVKAATAAAQDLNRQLEELRQTRLDEKETE